MSSAPERVLADLGWDADLTTHFAPHHARGAVPGRVVRVDRGSISVALAGGDELRLPLAGRLRGDPPQGGVTVGDWVAVEGGMVVAVLPRRTVFLRKVAGDLSAAQAVAANVDLGIVAVPLGAGANLRRLERSLALVWSSGARPLVLLTKADLSENLDDDVASVLDIAAPAEVIAVSAAGGMGLDALRAALAPAATAVLLGPSGAGKSTLVNLLCGVEMLHTAAVRDDGRGRHTTTHRQLVRLPGGALLVDTPGMRELALWDADEGIAEQFADITELAARCRFSDCSHHREPGCAVRAAMHDDPRLRERLQSSQKLEREQRRIDSRRLAHLRAERHREVRAFSRAIRNRPDKRDPR